MKVSFIYRLCICCLCSGKNMFCWVFSHGLVYDMPSVRVGDSVRVRVRWETGMCMTDATADLICSC